jgi:hypothetical protein
MQLDGRKLLLILSLFFAQLAVGQTKLHVNQGLVDLTQWDEKREPLLTLEGTARFYWNTFRVSAPSSSIPPEMISIHGSWDRHTTHPLHGYASYEFDFISDRERPIAVDLGTVAVAHRIYVDGKLLDVSGDPQSLKESYQKGPARQTVVTFILPQGQRRLTIETANFEYMLSGIVKPVVIGTPAAVVSHRYAGLAPALVLFGAYLAMALYHFGLFTLRRRDRGSLYFGLFCLAMLPSTVINMQVNALELYAEVPLALGIYLASSFGIASGFLGLFISYLWDSPWSRRISLLLLGFCLILAFVQAFDLQLYLVLLGVKFLIGLVQAGFLTRTIARAVGTRQQSSMMMLVSCCLLICTAINDFANFNNWIQSTPLFSFGSLAFLMIQSYLLSVRFSNAFQQIEQSEREIRQLSAKIKAEHDHVVALNENLEVLAEEKTRDIRSIMSHIQLGIFAITPGGYRIHKDYSEHLRDIFEVDQVMERSACQLLFDRSDLSTDAVSQAVSCIEAALGESSLVFDMNAHCLPQDLRYTSPSGHQKLLELSWHPMANFAGNTEKILVTVKDVTAIRALAEEAHDKKEELEFISELLNVQAEAFRRFLQDSKDFLAENRKLINSRSIQLKDLEVLKVLFINMHTMKGASRSLYFKKMTTVFHDVEQYYAHLQKDKHAAWDATKMNADLDEAEKIIAVYVSIYQNKLSRRVHGEREMELSESKLVQLYEKFVDAERNGGSTSGAEPFMKAMRSFFLSSLFTPAREAIQDMCRPLDTLAKDLQKEKPVVSIEARDLFLNHKGEALLRKIFVHLLRNTMDHGIETPQERLEKRKSKEGRITIVLNPEADEVQLRYQDDGRGLDLGKIRRVATERNLVKNPQALRKEEIAELIFCSGLSTASQLNDISGRGVGMDAVRSYLQKMGGSITICLLEQEDPKALFNPFSFDIRLPRSLFAEAGDQNAFAAA